MKKCFVISPVGEEGSELREHADNVLDLVIKPATKRLDIDGLGYSSTAQYYAIKSLQEARQ